MDEVGLLYVNLSKLTLDGQKLPITPVKSQIIWTSPEPAFRHLVREIREAPQPGFFLTTKTTGKEARVRYHLNRHCIIGSEVFYDSRGQLYRDIDAKGVGYTRGFPMRFLSVREPEMDGDMEMRGILHRNVAEEDCLNTEEMHKLGIRMARHVAQIELFELVDQDGSIVPREVIGKRIGVNLDKVSPILAIRVMGTTSRVYDLKTIQEAKNQGYVREVLDDALSLVSLELGQKLKPKDYVVWFAETMGSQLGVLHKNGVWTDFSMQIHRGTHNLTLDCRLTDTYHYQTPKSYKRSYKRHLEMVRKDPRLADLLGDRLQEHPREEVEANHREGEAIDKRAHGFVLEHFIEGVCEFYPTRKMKETAKKIFNRAYEKARTN